MTYSNWRQLFWKLFNFFQQEGPFISKLTEANRKISCPQNIFSKDNKTDNIKNEKVSTQLHEKKEVLKTCNTELV